MPSHALETFGAITVASADLEATLTRLIGIIASPQHTSPVEYLVHADPLRAKLDKLSILSTETDRSNGRPVISSVNTMWPRELCERVRELVRQIESGRDDRNMVVHSQWAVQSDDAFAYLRRDTTGRSRMQYRMDVWTHGRLEGVLASLLVVAGDALRLWGDFFQLWAEANPDRIATQDDAVVIGTGEIIRGGAASDREGSGDGVRD